MSKLAIIDWGIGGVGVRKAIYEIRPTLPVIYLSDTGVTPYGKMTRTDLARRLDTVIAYFSELGVTHLVIGCNAASTAIPYLRQTDVRIEGMIDVAVDVARSSAPERLGVIGGRRTILSGQYRRKLERSDIRPLQRIAQPLSALIEKGDLASEELRSECRKILRPLRDRSHILLACTHYSAIKHIMAEFVSPDTVFLDPAPALARSISSWELTAEGSDRFLTTGDPEQMKQSARAAFGWNIVDSEKIEL